MSPAPHVVFSHELSKAFRRGHPVANPQPVELQSTNSNGVTEQLLRPAEIGDVGYIQPEHGFFISIFNVHKEPGTDGQPCIDDLPDGFEPMPKTAISKTTDTTPVFLSQSVTTTELDISALGPFFGGSAGFSSSTKCGAILATPDPITCYNAIHILRYKAYAKDHLRSWYEFARRRGHDIALEDLIFVTGVDYTTSWATAVFVDAQLQAGFGLQVQFANVGDGVKLACRYSWSRTSGALVNHGPAQSSRPSPSRADFTFGHEASVPVPLANQDAADVTTEHELGVALRPMNTLNNQTLFVRSIRAKRRLPWPGLRIEARGEKDEDDSDDNSDDGDDTDIIDDAAAMGNNSDDFVLSRDPKRTQVQTYLDDILDHILLNSDSDIALAHDEDLDLPVGLGSLAQVVPVVQDGVGMILCGHTDNPATSTVLSMTDRVQDNVAGPAPPTLEGEEAHTAPSYSDVTHRPEVAGGTTADSASSGHTVNALDGLSLSSFERDRSSGNKSHARIPRMAETDILISQNNADPFANRIASFMDRGYIANMFESAARTYWSAVLKTTPEGLPLQMISGPSPCWCISPHEHTAGAQNAGRVLDYMLDADHATGPVVPQQLWQPLYKRIREVLVDNSRLCMPVFFVAQESGHVGLSLSDALAKKHYLLQGHDQAVDLGGKVTTHIRILWKGYAEYKRQIQIQDQTNDRKPITLSRLVEHVARTVQRFVEKPPQRNEDDFDPRWTVGPDGLSSNDLILVGIVHSSAGTWQPILQLSRPLPHLEQPTAPITDPLTLLLGPYTRPRLPGSSLNELRSVSSGEDYDLWAQARSRAQFSTAIVPAPSPPEHQHTSSYPSSPNPQMTHTDGAYLPSSPPYGAHSSA
ncbi:unnamed protein product [Peniophora sp. CBMAI 1063]|nr:unnamed protein product [Peniophora sp. CBMAI 1063]